MCPCLGWQGNREPRKMLFILPSNFLVEDTCNPLPGFIPTYKTVGFEQSAGCRLYPEAHLPGRGFDEVSWEPATFDAGLWGGATEAAAESSRSVAIL